MTIIEVSLARLRAALGPNGELTEPKLRHRVIAQRDLFVSPEEPITITVRIEAPRDVGAQRRRVADLLAHLDARGLPAPPASFVELLERVHCLSIEGTHEDDPDWAIGLRTLSVPEVIQGCRGRYRDLPIVPFADDEFGEPLSLVLGPHLPFVAKVRRPNELDELRRAGSHVAFDAWLPRWIDTGLSPGGDLVLPKGVA